MNYYADSITNPLNNWGGPQNTMILKCYENNQNNMV